MPTKCLFRAAKPLGTAFKMSAQRAYPEMRAAFTTKRNFSMSDGTPYFEPAPTASIAVVSAIAPTGFLRVAINTTNEVLVSFPKVGAPEVPGPKTEYQGVAPDVARLLAEALGVGLVIVPFDNPSELAATAETEQWDIAVLGIEPVRAEIIDFTAPMLEIDATFAVPPSSHLMQPIDDVSEGFGEVLHDDLLQRVDKPGVRIAVAVNSAYDLWLSRSLKQATLVRGGGGEEDGGDRHMAALDLARSGDSEGAIGALAGLRPWLKKHVAPMGWSLMPGRFTVIEQALGQPRRCADSTGMFFLESFVRDLKTSGRMQLLLEKHGVQEMASVAK
jgi:polar amino acid transport system substrate-binding protein